MNGTLQGEQLTLRLLERADLELVHARLQDLEARGPWFPLGLRSWTAFERDFAAEGLWTEHEGMLVMVAKGVVVGEIEFFPLSQYLPGYELSYLVFDLDARGKGYASAAVALLSEHLFATRRVGRLQLVIHPANVASQRVAERAGYGLDGVLRAAWFRDGTFHDVQVWSRVGPLVHPHHPNEPKGTS